jgi:hypothetical protein
MINQCQNCKAVREYPDGRVIQKCPRCDSVSIKTFPSPTTKEERDKFILEAITGKYSNDMEDN